MAAATSKSGNASARRSPAPPRASGTSVSTKPDASSARQSGAAVGAALDGADGRRRARVGEQALERLGELVASLQRSPRPRAIMPRRISRVPPRSENVGANWVT